MNFRAFAPQFLLISLMTPALGWSYLGAPPRECTSTTPYEDTPASKADVIFRAKASGTHGSDTDMRVIAVSKGEMPSGNIVFKHATAPKQQPLNWTGRRYYLLTTGHIYLIYAKKTSRNNILSQLYDEDYCGSSVIEQP
jgi:hypothetical protein